MDTHHPSQSQSVAAIQAGQGSCPGSVGRGAGLFRSGPEIPRDAGAQTLARAFYDDPVSR